MEQDIWQKLERLEKEGRGAATAPIKLAASKGKQPGKQHAAPATEKAGLPETRFELIEVGHAHDLELEVRPTTYNPSLPPITHTSHYPLLSTDEDPKHFLETKYIDTNPHHVKDIQQQRKFWPRTFSDAELYHLELSLPSTTIDVVTEPQTGEIRGFREIKTAETLSTATNSTSLVRAPGSLEDFARGSSANLPFKPGGLGEDDEAARARAAARQALAADALNFEKERLLVVPPGFKQGLLFDDQKLVSVVAEDMRPVEAAEKRTAGGALFKASTHSLIAKYGQDVDPREVLYRLRRRDGGGRRGGEGDGGGQVNLRNVFDAAEDEDLFGAAKPAATEEATEGEEEEEEEAEEEAGKEADAKEKGEEAQPAKTEAPAPAAAAAVTPADAAAAAKTAEAILDDLLGTEDIMAILDKRVKKKKKQEETWAVMDNTDVSNFTELVPKMALEFPFDLDTFQKEAIYHLENNESVFVAAHTSAGKTVVAEYAVALCAKHMTRAIYTSPIKALSNQKFRDFKETFGDVGLITGDVQVNPTAAALIVTTEILRSMLYKGADIIRDVEWVIFDEVHYINDLERGVVWEEVIIMLPAHVNIILLSATVPNTFEFADWIGRTKRKKIYVISTQKRPTPLEHYLFANDEMYKIVDGRDKAFMTLGYKAASDSFKEKAKQSQKAAQPKYVTGAARQKAEVSQWNMVVKMLKEKRLLPVVVFSFSKRKCEDCAYGLSNVDLSTNKEKSEIHVFFEQSMNRLKAADRKLPQVLRIKELLKRGIGVHHGGLLPIIKEVVEILFSRGLVKVLFATETFAMGVNMPARTVVFNALTKHDGRALRELLPGEYTQMSGRAGRRGLDKVGTVIIACWHEVPEPGMLKRIILGKPGKLESQFRLTYNMILNLLRVEDFKVEDMIKRSFSEFHSQRVIPEQQALLSQVENELKKSEEIICIFGEPDIENYHSLYSELKRIDKDMQAFILQSRQGIAALVPGRVVTLNSKAHPSAIGVVMKPSAFSSASLTSSTGGEAQQKSFQILILKGRQVQRAVEAQRPVGAQISYELVDVPISQITSLAAQRLKIEAQLDAIALSALNQQLLRLLEANPEGPPPIDPLKELKIQDIDFVEKSRRRAMIWAKMTQSKCHGCRKLDVHYEQMDKQARLKRRYTQLRFALSDENLLLMPEFQQRCTVLQRLNYIDEEKAVQLKGRVARELNTVNDELIATELIFENILTDLTPEEIVALLSALLFDEKDATEPALTERLEETRDIVIKLAVSLANLQRECGLDISVDEYCRNLNFNMMEVVYEWARGMPFADITQLTNVLEGSIVRCITRLDETCKEVRNAARIIGDSSLYQKMEEASRLIKRDIVFASSLYIS